MKYYFISKNNYDDMTLEPRVPKYKYNCEDRIINRICVSQSIYGCLSAISSRFNIGDIVFVHECESDKAIQPTVKQVVDVSLTGEQWILEPTKMKLIMKIRITDVMNLTLGEMDNSVCAFELYS